MTDMEIIRKIAESAHSLIKNEHTVAITKYNPYLVDVLHLCIHNQDLIGGINAHDAGDVGVAFMYILNLTDDSNSEVFPTYSSISFYFMQKYLNQGSDIIQDTEHVRILTNMIFLMNIGARSFCRTIAYAYNQNPSDYIDFSDLKGLPSYVKKVLILEFGYFKELYDVFNSNPAFSAFGIGMSNELQTRFHFLKECVINGLFDGIETEEQCVIEADKVKAKVYGYTSRKIERGNIFFS